MENTNFGHDLNPLEKELGFEKPYLNPFDFLIGPQRNLTPKQELERYEIILDNYLKFKDYTSDEMEYLFHVTESVTKILKRNPSMLTARLSVKLKDIKSIVSNALIEMES